MQRAAVVASNLAPPSVADPRPRYTLLKIENVMAKKIPNKLKIWIYVRKGFHISHIYIQMARELGLNPKGFGKLVNHKQKPMEITIAIIHREYLLQRFQEA